MTTPPNPTYHYRAAKRLLKEAELLESTPERVDTLVKLADRHMVIYKELTMPKHSLPINYPNTWANPNQNQDWQVTYGDSTTSLTNVEEDVEGDAAGSGYQGV